MGEFEKYRATLSDYELLRSANCCRHAFEHQQVIIDSLKAQLNNMEACYIEKKKECEGLQGRIDDVEAECKDWHRLSGSGLAVRILEVLRGAND